MSVESALGHTQTQIEAIVDEHWADWTITCPDLALAGTGRDLRSWLLNEAPDRADRVLHSLAKLANVDGENVPLAAVVLTWCLAPGAGGIAHQCATLSPDIDIEVAAHLWIAARTFPWKTSRFVVFHIRQTIRRGLFGELSQPAGTIPLPVDILQHMIDDPNRRAERGSVDELSALLSDAVMAGVIKRDDVDLLLDVLDAAHELKPGNGPAAAVLGNKVSNRIAANWSCTARTVRRRTKKSLQALAGATRHSEELAEPWKSRPSQHDGAA